MRAFKKAVQNFYTKKGALLLFCRSYYQKFCTAFLKARTLAYPRIPSFKRL